MSALTYEMDVDEREESDPKSRVLIEDAVVATLIAAMVVLPVAEIVLRRFGARGISGSTTIVQHCTLAVSMLGAAIAARQQRLLTIATATFLPKRFRRSASFIASSIGTAVAALLAVASFRYVLTERASGSTLAYGVPLWLIELVLPLGFALIAMRLLASAWPFFRGRVAAGVLASIIVACIASIGDTSPAMLGAGIALIVLTIAVGAPIFAVIGIAALVAFSATGVSHAAMAVSHYSLVVNPSLPAIPLFTLAGYILAEGGASQRLVRVFNAIVGGFRGGPAIVTVLACAFFTTFTGGSGVTILALGGLLLPILRNSRYSEKNALGLVTGAGALGILFPPCLPLILYAIAASVDVQQLFLAGIIPGVLLLVLVAWLGRVQQPPVEATRRFDRREALAALWAARWELLLPIVVLGVLFGGIATPVEAAAITALYAFIIEAVIHRDYREPSKLLHVFTESGVLVGGILLILGVALGFTSFLIDAEVPQRAVVWATASIHSPLVFLLLLNLFLVLVGALMDIYSAIIVVVPLIIPLGAAFGIDPIHLGIVFLCNLELGYLVPPVGENLFIAAYRFDKPVGELARAVVPMIAILSVGVLAVTYIPALSLWLPSVFAK
jgi:tripartite ATP-independent transporter DctM subunit